MSHSAEEFRSLLKAARRAGTPLVAIRTADAASAVDHVATSIGGEKDTPLIAWDILNGLVGRNDAGNAAVAKVFGERSSSIEPAAALAVAQKIAQDTVLCFLNPQRIWEQPDMVQGIWNLRNVFKSGGQMLVLITTPGGSLPAELQSDVMVIDEPLPSPEELAAVVRQTLEAAELAEPEEATVSMAVDALVGLAAFPAEQVLAMSLSKAGLDFARLWDRKRQAVEQTPGLTIWRGGETFDQIGGCDNIKIDTTNYICC
ncbi:MAG: hypothetical protein ACRD7E_20670 [Bryobacteraceae bacterium]